MGLLVIIFVGLVLSFILLCFVGLIMFRESVGQGSVASFECGFEKGDRLCARVRYFMLVLVFLVFDLELLVMLLIPIKILGVNCYLLLALLLSL